MQSASQLKSKLFLEEENNSKYDDEEVFLKDKLK